MEIIILDKKHEVIRIFRLLTPKNRKKFLALVHKVSIAENSKTDTLGTGFPAEYIFSGNKPDYSSENLIERRKK